MIIDIFLTENFHVRRMFYRACRAALSEKLSEKSVRSVSADVVDDAVETVLKRYNIKKIKHNSIRFDSEEDFVVFKLSWG